MSFMSKREAAEALLGHYRHPAGVMPGGFCEQLITCFEKADPSNQHRLLLGFPEFRDPLTTIQSRGSNGLALALSDGEFE